MNVAVSESNAHELEEKCLKDAWDYDEVGSLDKQLCSTAYLFLRKLLPEVNS